MGSHLGRRIGGLFGATFVALAISGNGAATTCVTHSKVCQTLVIQPAGPLRVYVQALSCIAAQGLTWDVRVTDGSHAVHVAADDSPSVVPGRRVKVPFAGRWWLDVRMSNTDPSARCVRGGSSTDPVRVLGISATPGSNPRPASGSKRAASPTAGVLSAQSAGSPGPSASAGLRLRLPMTMPPYEGGDTSPEGVGGSGSGGPLGVLVLFAMGLAGIELIAFAIRRELRLGKGG